MTDATKTAIGTYDVTILVALSTSVPVRPSQEMT